MNVCRDKGLPWSPGLLGMNYGGEAKICGVQWNKWRKGRNLSLIYKVKGSLLGHISRMKTVVLS